MIGSGLRAAHGDASARPGALQILAEAIREVGSRRRLIRYLVAADMKRRGANTVLGNLWWILDPLLQMVVYVIFVTIVARRAQPDYPLFVFAAILPWKWFSAAISDSTASVVSRAGLLRQIAFPKLVLPAAAVTAEVVGFALGIIPLVGIMLFYPGRLTFTMVWIPVIALVQYVFTLACATLVAAGNVYFRDLGNVSAHVLRLWFFLSPGLYSLAWLDETSFFQKHHWIQEVAALNPFAVLFEAYRSVIYGTPDGGLPVPPNIAALAMLLVASVGFLAVAVVIFKRLEPDFAKVL